MEVCIRLTKVLRDLPPLVTRGVLAISISVRVRPPFFFFFFFFFNAIVLATYVVSVYPHRLLAFSQNVRPGEGSVPTGPTTGKLQSLMTSRAEKGTQDLMR